MNIPDGGRSRRREDSGKEGVAGGGFTLGLPMVLVVDGVFGCTFGFLGLGLDEFLGLGVMFEGLLDVVI